ncbi:multi-component regulatory system-4 [Streptomyces sp. PRh5]|nr:multi-component regulatory system-4 [Streptomyces sp. PRh5]
MAAGEPVPHDAAAREGAGQDAEDDAPAAPEPREPLGPPEPEAPPESVEPPEPAVRASAVRPFLLTAGRVAGSGAAPPLPVETQIVATPDGLSALRSLAFERRDIVAACRRPQSVAELAARLHLHLNVVRVLAEDLCAAGHLAVHVPNAGTVHDISVLRRVIDGLRAVPDSRGSLRDSG